MMTVQGRALGARRPLFADWSIPLPPELSGDGGDAPTLRRLIEAVVRREVEAFRTRAQARRLDRVLSREDISRGVSKGRVDPGGRDVPADVDDEAAVHAAIQAFEDGLYLVIIDGHEHRDLNARIALGPDSTVTFLRLTLLAGGF
jgi:hypothetical protein